MAQTSEARGASTSERLFAIIKRYIKFAPAQGRKIRLGFWRFRRLTSFLHYFDFSKYIGNRISAQIKYLLGIQGIEKTIYLLSLIAITAIPDAIKPREASKRPSLSSSLALNKRYAPLPSNSHCIGYLLSHTESLV